MHLIHSIFLNIKLIQILQKYKKHKTEALVRNKIGCFITKILVKVNYETKISNKKFFSWK